MKKYLGLLIIAVLVSVSTTFAQKTELKFGHINSNELLSAMPERDSAGVELQKYSKMLSDELENMQVEYQKKVSTYLEKQASFSDLVQKSKEAEFQEMQQRIQGFRQTAQQDLQRKEGELMQPIMDKAQAAIEKVAKAGGFTYIFDLGAGGVLYFSEQSIDILPLVKKELGIK